MNKLGKHEQVFTCKVKLEKIVALNLVMRIKEECQFRG